MSDTSEVIRHEAAFLLGATRDKRAVNALIKSVKRDPSNLVRHEAIEALGDLKIKSADVTNLLKQLTKSKVSFIRDTAVVALRTLEI